MLERAVGSAVLLRPGPRAARLPGGLDPGRRARRAATAAPDPRTVGSGRTGGTNALRALGRKWATVVVVGDLLKGALPVLLARS